MDGCMRWEMGTLISNYTHIKDGVDLKARFLKVLDEHPFANMWSNAAKKVIAGELYEAVMKDTIDGRNPEEWRENIEFKNAETSSKRTSG